MYRSKEFNVGSTDRVPKRLRGPDPPSGLLPFFGSTLAQRPNLLAMSRGAAFFDLDRTLLAGASGEVFSEAMRSAGLVSRSIPGERLLFRMFNAIGETLPSMALARQAVTLSKGRPRAAVQAAAESVAEQLASMLQPFADSVFARHREAGRPLVLATTTPYDLVKPFADLIGLDDVVATRWTVNADGTYDGTLAGPFVWSAGKLAAVREWAEQHDVDLDESYAYSDSVYDVPLLAAVGFPIVVNPDPRMMVFAAARRWPVLNLDVSPGVRKIPVVGLEVQKLAMQFTRPAFVPYARFDIEGVDNVPETGAAILVANHRSYFDTMAISMLIAKTGRTVRFLGKKEVFDAPIVGQLAAAMGGIRVDRGTGSDEPLRAAADALLGGEMVTLMPQGTIPRGPAFFDPDLKGRWGAARLAQLSGAPIIPVGLWGTEKVWPRSSRIPNVLNLTDPPVVQISVGEPVDLKYRSLDADTKRIMTAIRRQLPPEASVAHTPTDEELRLTYPPGYRGDPDLEVERRPGTD
jgi:putative phosphoserine phosphatase/1-acylglycerol-3-phosphate O-acyltransferase